MHAERTTNKVTTGMESDRPESQPPGRRTADTTPIPWAVTDILAAVRGVLAAGSATPVFEGVSIDSRTIRERELFVAIRGPVHDGHRFVDDVLRKGIRGVVVAEDSLDRSLMNAVADVDAARIVVRDTDRALADMGLHQRQRSRARVVAITGSNGKTTTRSMCAVVLGRRYNVHATRGNFNNRYGLPLTLLNLGRAHEWAVVELGMNHPGEIRELGNMCLPDIGVITNIGPAHLEGVGSLEGVARAKGELLETVAKKGVVVLNADDAYCMALAGRASRRVILYGVACGADIRADRVRQSADGIRFHLHTPEGETDAVLPVIGEFMVSNALAAAATGFLAGMTPEEIRDGLAGFLPVRNRLNVIRLAPDIRIIDDTYNANPASMKAAIETLARIRGGGRAIAFVGDMRELGDGAAALHRELGGWIAGNGVDRLYAVGDFADIVAEGALAAGMPPGRIMTGGKDDLAKDVSERLRADDCILVKGSRGMHMETVVDDLKKAVFAITATQPESDPQVGRSE